MKVILNSNVSLFHWFFTILGAVPTDTTPPTITGLLVKMSDGTEHTITLGPWLTIDDGQLRVVFPSQYVNQRAIRQSGSTWIYPHKGRNVQVWRNGLLQTLTTDTHAGDYTIDLNARRITPSPAQWKDADSITVAYLF